MRYSDICIGCADKHHFDNPVYAYQPVSKSQPNLNENGVIGATSSSSTTTAGALNTIHNNLHHNHHHKDTNNRHWDKLGNFTFDDDGASSIGERGLLGTVLAALVREILGSVLAALV